MVSSLLSKKSFKGTITFFVSCFLILGSFQALADDYTSTNFILRDPVIVDQAGFSTSNNFQYFSSNGQTSPGESTSSNFTYRSGFLYFPTASSPAISATAGDGQVSLTWTAATATLANITNYELGTATVSGGPYTFQSIGNVLSFVKTGLTNGTNYYFVVKADAGTLTLSQSVQVSSTPVASSTNQPSGGGSGGGGSGGGGSVGGGSSASNGVVPQVNFLGRAYPLSKVTVLKDGQVAITTIAGPDANFSVGLSGISTGNYIFSLYGEDNKGQRSTLFNFPLYITENAATTIGGIFIAPTIDVDKDQVKRGENIAIFGQSAPDSEITVSVNSDQEIFEKVKAKQDGSYLYNFDTSPLEDGQHSTKSKSAISGEISSFGKSVGFIIGSTSIAKAAVYCGKTDLNCDGRVNLVDFSILAYWYNKPNFPRKVDFNGDGKVDLTDFSIMAYYWTG